MKTMNYLMELFKMMESRERLFAMMVCKKITQLSHEINMVIQ